MQPEDFQKQFDVSRETLERLKTYDAMLAKWQRAINLVSPASLPESWNRHFSDSAQIANLIPSGSIVGDLGSGAGFPGLVLKILRPDIETHLIESDGRKCEFLKNVSRETAAPITVRNGRVENELNRFAPDVITARAFKSLLEILDMTAEAAKANPALFYCLLKGKSAREEVAEAQQKYSFDIEYKASQTEQGAQILLIKNVQALA